MRGISINDFIVAMETYGANRLEYTTGTRYDKSVPCFEICSVEFIHSGSNYIVQRDKKVSEEIMNMAMSKFGEKYPGGLNFWHGEIHTIKGILTLASLLEGKYSEEFVDQLTNETYKKLLDNPEIKSSEEVHFKEINSPKMKQLRRLLSEYSSIVNPFGNDHLHLKEPIEYLDTVSVAISTPDAQDDSPTLCLSTNSYRAEYYKDYASLCYDTHIKMQKNRRNKYLHISYDYNNGKDNYPVDEVVYIDYFDKAEKGYITEHPDNIRMCISLKTGLACETFHDELAKPATDEQLDFIIACLKASIKKIKRKIVNKMVIPA